MICPTCGGTGDISSPELTIDTMSNVVMCRTGSVRITSGEAVFLAALIKAYPEPVLYERAYALRWSREPKNVRNSIAGFAFKLARKLQPLGFSVKAVYGTGYALVRFI